MDGEMGAESDDETPLEQTVGGAVMALTFLVGFGLLALGVPWFWIAFPVGFAGILPMSIGLVKYYEKQRADTESRTQQSDQEAALEDLRNRYARGELSDDEFERKVEKLLETESVDDAETFASGMETDAPSHERSRERETE